LDVAQRCKEVEETGTGRSGQETAGGQGPHWQERPKILLMRLKIAITILEKYLEMFNQIL
jgi:hypothetical protein